MKDDLRYTPTDIFETFPFPDGAEDSLALEEVGRTYFEYRANWLATANEGMTDTWNRLNNPNEQSNHSIAELRRLHDMMDHRVLDAYGWSDIEPTPVFEREWVDEDGDGPWRYRWPEPVRDEVLARLLALNTKRAADEARRGLTIQGAESRTEDAEDSEEFQLEAEES